MNKEIKEILDDLRTYKDRYEYCLFNNISFNDRDYKAKLLLNYITNLQEENKRLKDLYKKTCKHLFNIGNDELARYFQAQINECNVFVPQDLRGEENE